MRRSSFKDNVNDSVKDKKDNSDKEKDKDNDKSNDLSQSDPKDDRKNEDKDNAIIKITSDEKKESKWDTIDWSKKSSNEKKESKWDTIDWSKKSSNEKKESKWDTIDWSKKKSDNEKTEENKYENIKDKSMNGEEFKEDFKDFNEKEVDNDFIQESNKEKDDKDDDLSWLKDYDENSEDIKLGDLSSIKDYDKNSEDIKLEDLSSIKDYDENSEDNKLEDLSSIKDYDENSEDIKLEDLSSIKDYDKNSEDNKLEDLSSIKDCDKNSEDSVFSEGIEKKQDEYETNEKNLDQKYVDDKINSNEDYEIHNIKNYIRSLDWEKVSNDWTIEIYTNQHSEFKKIQLDPKQDCSKDNPLYKNEDWLKRIYNDKKLNLNDKIIGEICSVHKSTIGKWRKNFDIPTKPKGPGKWIDSRTGRVRLLMPKDYKHPELKPWRGDRYARLENIRVMEQYLSKHPELEIAKKNLIDGKYLRTGCEVHHINFNKIDNRIENLWLYENKKDHAQGELTVRDSMQNLINTNQIGFKDGRYFINQDFDSIPNKSVQNSIHQDIINPVNFKNIDLINQEIKKIEWEKISNDWNVKVDINKRGEKIIRLDPYKDCSEINPLYRHKEWVKRLVNDKKFNLTDSRLGELCEISRDKARYWRDRVHNIKGKSDWGYDRVIDESDGRIWVRVPSDYGNPVVNKEDHQRRYMLEHRYVMERHLAQHPELEISNKVLIDGKYLKPECQVHHINLDYQDNRIENLWVFENGADHQNATNSLYNLVDDLLESELIVFKDGEYLINKK